MQKNFYYIHTDRYFRMESALAQALSVDRVLFCAVVTAVITCIPHMIFMLTKYDSVSSRVLRFLRKHRNCRITCYIDSLYFIGESAEFKQNFLNELVTITLFNKLELFTPDKAAFAEIINAKSKHYLANKAIVLLGAHMRNAHRIAEHKKLTNEEIGKQECWNAHCEVLQTLRDLKCTDAHLVLHELSGTAAHNTAEASKFRCNMALCRESILVPSMFKQNILQASPVADTGWSCTNKVLVNMF